MTSEGTDRETKPSEGTELMEIHAQRLDMPLAAPFRISRGVQHAAHNMLIRVGTDDEVGFGEAAPRAYYGETVETALAVVNTYAEHIGDDPFAIETIMTRLEHVLRHNNSVRAAIDMALYDLVGKRLGVPLYRLLGLSPSHLPRTSLTISIDTPAEMAHQAILARDYPILKIKLGTRHDLQIVREIRDVSHAILRIDANAAWSVKGTLALIEQLAPYHIEMIEQPIPPGDLAGMKLIHDNSPIPIFADESCITLEDVPRLAGVVDGINIKLAKSGGINHALKMIHTARAHGLKIMLGCMIESSLGITAAAHLSPLVDMVDLDGALLLESDPFVGVEIVEGQMMLPDAPGLGVHPRKQANSLATRHQRMIATAPTSPPASNGQHTKPSEASDAATHTNQEDTTMPVSSTHPTRADAWELMTAHVQQDSLRKHMLSVEAAMRAYAHKFGEDEEVWGITGLLHDSDYEEYPDLHEHTQVAAGWLRDRSYDERIIAAILAHNDINAMPREDLLAKGLAACDEVTGLITAASLVRPDKSIMNLEASSVRKKMKDKAFARAIHREDIIDGATALGVDLNDHIAFVITAMQGIAPELGLAGTDVSAPPSPAAE